MILRKPYAFFIKMFKPIHLVISFLIAYLIYLNSKILGFFNTYMYSLDSVIGQNIKSKFINDFLFIIPIAIIVLSLIILGVMIRKKKPSTFYFINIFAHIVVIVISVYTSNFMGVLEESIVSIKVIKLIHDLVLINILIESMSFIFFVVRGMGINFKKFNFESELSQFDINESDKEEFEFDINVDLAEARRKRKKNFRFLKYKYLENKFLINIIIFIVLILSSLGIFLLVNINNRANKEGKIYTINNLNIGVDNTMILNTNYKGEQVTENYLVIVNCKMQSFDESKKNHIDDFSLKIGETIFKPTLKYSSYIIDIGNVYDESSSLTDYGNYLFVYEVPEKFINSDMIFNYQKLSINLDPKNLNSNELSISKHIGEELDFKESVGNIRFNINDYEISDNFSLWYNYCVKEDDCVLSKEYIKPSINTNFDKTVLRVNVDYTNESSLNLKSFYQFFSRFGIIEYKIGDIWYLQSVDFEELKGKVNTKDSVYIGVKSDISGAESIKLVFNIRDCKYEYILK